jgi:RND superfamily putative drug exporter
LCRSFGYLDNVERVGSLTRPLGQTPGHYLASVPGKHGNRSVTRLEVSLKSDPVDEEGRATLGVIQAYLQNELPKTGLQAKCAGVAVTSADLANVIGADRSRVGVLVLAAMFAILAVWLRKPWLAACLLATVVLGYLAALGATALAAGLWSGQSLDGRVPLFLFPILVSVGTGYHIFLVAPALRERTSQSRAEIIRRTLTRTSGTMTSYGVIMAAAFGALMLSHLGTFTQLGFAMAFGVLLDVFLIRRFLVPAIVQMVLGGAQTHAFDQHGKDLRARGLRRAG